MRFIAGSLDRARAEGGPLLIEGPPGIGKTRLLGELDSRAREAGFRVLTARGSEMERDFGFGVVRQLLGATVEAMDESERSRVFSGSAALAAPIFEMAQQEAGDAGTGEASLYGLFWLVTGLAEAEPTVLLVDDAHWADSTSLRFIRYLGKRIDGIPVLIALGARPNEPGAQAEVLAEVAAELDPPTLRPAPLSKAGTTEFVRARLDGRATTELGSACHEATGGNPLLIHEVLADLDSRGEGTGEIPPEAVKEMGPARIARSVMARSERLDPLAGDLVRAAAILGDASSLRTVSALAGIPPERAATIADGLAATSILANGSKPRFAHPLLRTSVYDSIPSAGRASAHARAAALLREHGAEPEEVAAHLLVTEPGGDDSDLEVLDRAARDAAVRGAPESTVAYLRRALAEPVAAAGRDDLLRRLGNAEVSLRDPAAIPHLQEAAEIADDPEQSIAVTIQLADALSMAGQWDPIGKVLEGGLSRHADPDLPGSLHLEAYRAAHRGYDPAQVGDFERDLPRLWSLVESRRDPESRHLRWLLAGIGSIRDLPTETVVSLIAPPGERLVPGERDGWESPLVVQAALALLIVDAVEEARRIEESLREEGRRRGSLMAMVAGGGFAAALNARAGGLDTSEADVRTAMEMLEGNEFGLVALTTFLYYCSDTIVERGGLADVADLALAVEMPGAFARTLNGGLTLELKAIVHLARGERAAALEELRGAERIYRPLAVGPRSGPWRSRLALALPDESREEALALVAEELDLARRVTSARAEGVALRSLGLLVGGEEGVELLRDSAAILRDSPAELELARSLTALGGALRRGNRRAEAREPLREALELAQRLGAERLEEHLFDELRIAGARLHRRELSGVGALTPAELRVVTAAAGGAANREIAQNLFVSLRTVEMHLTNSYRKLGVSSRADLAEAIASDAG